MGVPCEGGSYKPALKGECCSRCVKDVNNKPSKKKANKKRRKRNSKKDKKKRKNSKKHQQGSRRLTDGQNPLDSSMDVNAIPSFVV
jgi:hypothetical protein